MRLSFVSMVGLGLLSGCVFCASAQAQDAGSLRVQHPFRIKVGAFFPSDRDIRDTLGNTFFSYGISYDIAKSRAPKPVIYSAYIDGATKSRNVDFDGVNINFRYTYTGVGPSVRFAFNPLTQHTRFFGGLGLGAYFVNIRASADAGDNVTVSRSETYTRFGGKLFAGAELTNRLFAEVDYTYIREIEQGRPGGFNASVGYRF